MSIQSTINTAAINCTTASASFRAAGLIQAANACEDVAAVLVMLDAGTREWPTMNERRVLRAAERAISGQPRKAVESLMAARK